MVPASVDTSGPAKLARRSDSSASPSFFIDQMVREALTVTNSPRASACVSVRQLTLWRRPPTRHWMGKSAIGPTERALVV